MTVIRFPGHKWYKCGRDCEGCMICNGGLGSCVVCSGAECELTTDCCGEELSQLTKDLVCSGVLDYTRKEGWVNLADNRIPVNMKYLQKTEDNFAWRNLT